MPRFHRPRRCQTRSSENSDGSHVYIIRSRVPVEGCYLMKIGYTVNPEQRLKNIRTGCPYAIDMEFLLSGDRKLERKLHTVFEKYKTDSKNEWFRIPVDYFEIFSTMIRMQLAVPGRWKES